MPARESAGGMDPRDGLKNVREALSARTVFGAPIEREGVTVIPAAWVAGGGGAGGSDGSEEGTPAGGGGGFGLFARPVGVFEIRDSEVRWHPAHDRTWLIIASIPIVLAIVKYFLSRD